MGQWSLNKSIGIIIASRLDKLCFVTYNRVLCWGKIFPKWPPNKNSLNSPWNVWINFLDVFFVGDVLRIGTMRNHQSSTHQNHHLADYFLESVPSIEQANPSCFFPWKYNPSTFFGQITSRLFTSTPDPWWLIVRECSSSKCRNTWGSGSKYKVLLNY